MNTKLNVMLRYFGAFKYKPQSTQSQIMNKFFIKSTELLNPL